MSITIPESVTSIEKSAFSGCSSLTSIIIPNGVTSIGYYAFEGCSGLTSITIPFVGENTEGNGATYFGYLFGASLYNFNSSYVPKSLKEVTITGGTSISDHAFYGCSGLTSITIPDSVTRIGTYAFSGCSGLTSIIIPDSVTSIENYAFENCSKLTRATFENPNGWWYSSRSTATSRTNISSSSLSNPGTAAKYLKQLYYSYYWKRS